MAIAILFLYTAEVLFIIRSDIYEGCSALIPFGNLISA